MQNGMCCFMYLYYHKYNTGITVLLPIGRLIAQALKGKV